MVPRKVKMSSVSMNGKTMIVKLAAFSGRIGTHLLSRKFVQIRNTKVSLLFALIYFNNVVSGRSLSISSSRIFFRYDLCLNYRKARYT